MSAKPPHPLDARAHVDLLVRAALNAARPGDALAQQWPPKAAAGPCRILAVGKAAGSMVRAVAEHRLCAHLESAIVVGPPGVGDSLDLPIPLEIHEADHPLPTIRNVDAARRVADFVRSGADTVPLVVLLSGGASAMLSLPAPPLTLDDCRAVTNALLRSGAPIEALNCVRKHLEVLKGGGLARVATPRPIWTLVLSDVIGDDLSSIGSGPTCADPTTFQDALDILSRYNALAVSRAATDFLTEGAAGMHRETVKPGDPILAAVHHRIIASNRIAVEAVAGCARELGYDILSLTHGVTGDAATTGRELAAGAIKQQKNQSIPAAIILGGETTVVVRGDGRGGRNQELALAAAIELQSTANITVASFATDGVDGNSTAAGATGTSSSVKTAAAAGVSAAACLQRNDSNRFFAACNGLITTGPTGTNVNDITIALIHPT